MSPDLQKPAGPAHPPGRVKSAEEIMNILVAGDSGCRVQDALGCHTLERPG
jgi:hypothetical protein